MSLKNKLLLAASIVIVCSPLVSYADLVTVNNTKEFSAVRVLATNICSGDKGRFTEPGKTNPTPDLAVRTLCLFSTTCKAVMYASKNCTPGTEIANVQLNSMAMSVSSIDVTNARYSVTGVGGATVTIGYTG